MRGTIKQRAKGSWTIILDMGRDPATGKRRQKWITHRGSKKSTEAKLSELLHQIDTGGFVQPNKLTVGASLRRLWCLIRVPGLNPPAFPSLRPPISFAE